MSHLVTLACSKNARDTLVDTLPPSLPHVLFGDNIANPPDPRPPGPLGPFLDCHVLFEWPLTLHGLAENVQRQILLSRPEDPYI